MYCKGISIESKKELQPYFDLVNYEGCEYCFGTLYMWQHVYKTSYFIEKDFAVIVAEYEGNSFSILPLAPKDKLLEAVSFVIDKFRSEGKKIFLRGITKDVVELLKVDYPEQFIYTEERDLFDYIYDGESLRTLAGRKNQKKRNHLNYFLKEYENRYEYKVLGKENFNECVELLNYWSQMKDESPEDSDIEDEIIGINKIFDNYDELKDNIKIAGIYIDSKLQAFTIGELLNPDMALVHIEKADPNIRGLYPFINQQFILNEFPEVEFVNREEDLGIEGLRKAKLSYHPVRFVEKYTVREK